MHLLDNVKIWNAFRRALDWQCGMYQKAETVIRRFGVDRTMSILDVGCGSGQYARLTDGEYLGIDSNPRYIAAAAQRYGNGRRKFLCARLQEVDLSQRRFDVALLKDLTHHIADDDLRTMLRGLANVTRLLVVLDPVQQSRGNWLGRILTALDRGRFIRPKERELELLREDFEIIRVNDVQHFLTTEGIAVLARPKTTADAPDRLAATP